MNYRKKGGSFIVKAAQCPQCHSPLAPHEEQCTYCDCYIVRTKGTYATMNLEEHARAVPFVDGVRLHPNERAIRTGIANYVFNIFISDGGRLLLTNERLVFYAHRFNLHPHKIVSIPLETITTIEPSGHFGFTQKMTIHTKKAAHSLIVYRRNEWFAALHEAMRHIT